MKILLLEADALKREFLQFFLEGRFQAEVFSVADVPAAKAALELHQYSFGMAVCPFGDAQGKDLMRFVFESSAPIYFVCISDNPIDLSGSKKLKQWVAFVDPADVINGLGRKMIELDPGSAVDTRAKSLQYAPVRFEFLPYWGQARADLFLKKTASAFAKALPAGATWSDELRKGFEDKNGAECLYIKSDQVMPVLHQLQPQAYPGAQSVDARFGLDTPAPGAQERTSAGAAGFNDPLSVEEVSESLNRLQAMGARLGFTEEVQAFARQSVQKTIDDVKKSPRLSMILAELNKDRDQYIASHSMLLSFMACALATQVDWKSDTTYQKLSLAAFLHDITLTNQEIARYDSLRTLIQDREKFSDEDFRAYRTHPADGAEIARQFREVPPDVDQVIAQHHERPDGTGFPRGLTHTRINPLSVVFIVAHDVVRFMIDKGVTQQLTEVQWSEFLTLHAETYKHSQFKKLLEIFKGIPL